MTPARILVVEDEAVVAADIENHLRGMGYDVCGLIMSGEEAVAQAQEKHPDLVLMDISLSGDMDGVEAADYINETTKIPVVFLTAYTNEDVLARARVTEPFGYLLKPFQARELYTTIEMALYKPKWKRKEPPCTRNANNWSRNSRTRWTKSSF